MQSLCLATPVQSLSDSRLAMCWLQGDWPPGEMFTVPLSPNGESPASHLLLHYFTNPTDIQALMSGTIPDGYRSLPCDLTGTGDYLVTEEHVLAAASTWLARASENTDDVMANFLAFLSENGLMRI